MEKEIGLPGEVGLVTIVYEDDDDDWRIACKLLEVSKWKRIEAIYRADRPRTKAAHAVAWKQADRIDELIAQGKFWTVK